MSGAHDICKCMASPKYLQQQGRQGGLMGMGKATDLRSGDFRFESCHGGFKEF